MEAEDGEGFMTGAASGAATGGTVGGVPGAIAGGLIGGYLGASQSSKQRRGQKKAEQEAERIRQQNIMKQMGARMQADNLAMADTRIGGAGKAKAVDPKNAGGFIGSNITSSGTF